MAVHVEQRVRVVLAGSTTARPAPMAGRSLVPGAAPAQAEMSGATVWLASAFQLCAHVVERRFRGPLLRDQRISSSVKESERLMKNQIRLTALLLAASSVPLATARNPDPRGHRFDAPVSAAIAGRPNHALASVGGVAFSSTDLTPDYAAARVNDGVINQTGNSWIPSTTAPPISSR